MTVKEIVHDWLKEHGYDGLCSDCCGCGLDELFPCDEGGCADCVPGHLTRECDDTECEWYGVSHFHAMKQKENKP